jgi:toxin ParE1/3/4
MTPLHRSLQAQVDLREIVDTLSLQSGATAERFLAAVARGFEFLQSFPHAGSRVPMRRRRFASYRVWRVPGFRSYLIFYRVRNRRIEVARVVHGARDWQSFLE